MHYIWKRSGSWNFSSLNIIRYTWVYDSKLEAREIGKNQIVETLMGGIYHGV